MHRNIIIYKYFYIQIFLYQKNIYTEISTYHVVQQMFSAIYYIIIYNFL